MRQLSTREKVLVVLLAIGAPFLYFYFGPDGLGFGTREPEPEEVASYGEAPRVPLHLLEKVADGYDPQGRNLFQYYVPPKPPPPPPPPRPVKKPVKRPAVRPPAPPKPPPVKRGPPQPSFQYIGQLGPKDDRIFYFDAGDEVLYARLGGVLEEQYRVVGFEYDAVELGYTDEEFRGQTTKLKMNPK